MLKFLWITPIPPNWAMAMAIFASVTVSMAAEIRGMPSFKALGKLRMGLHIGGHHRRSQGVIKAPGGRRGLLHQHIIKRVGKGVGAFSGFLVHLVALTSFLALTFPSNSTGSSLLTSLPNIPFEATVSEL